MGERRRVRQTALLGKQYATKPRSRRLTDRVEVSLDLLRELALLLLPLLLLLLRHSLSLLPRSTLLSRLNPVPHHPLGDHRRRHLLSRLLSRVADVLLQRSELGRVQLGDGRAGAGSGLRSEGLRWSLLGTGRHGGCTPEETASGKKGSIERCATCGKGEDGSVSWAGAKETEPLWSPRGY